jgi:hypothetical protein
MDYAPSVKSCNQNRPESHSLQQLRFYENCLGAVKFEPIGAKNEIPLFRDYEKDPQKG